MRTVSILQRIRDDEQGHATAGVPALAAAVAAIALGIGAAADSDVVMIISGVVLGVGVLGASLGQHMGVDYDVFRRLEELEK